MVTGKKTINTYIKQYFCILDPYPVINPSGGEVNVLENQEAPLRIQIFTLAAYKLSPINEKANISVVIDSGKKIILLVVDFTLLVSPQFCLIPDDTFLFKGNNRNTRTMCKTCSKLTITTREQHRDSVALIVNFEHISHIVLLFSLLTLNK